MTMKRGSIPFDLRAVLALGFALRLAAWWAWPNVQWADEIFQVTEPAHRLVFGTGIVAWEWLVGIRSWLLPGIIAGLMELGRLFGGDDPELINLPFEIMMAALGCLPVLCGYLWGQNLYGRSGGVIAGFATAVWSDLVYMSPHTFNEVVAADLLSLGLFLGYPGTADARPSAKRVFWSGVVLGLVFAFRFHLAPALAIAAIVLCWNRSADWRAFMTGAAIPVIGLGILDWITLSTPFQSIWLNIRYNVVAGISREYGTDPWWMLVVLIGVIWAPVLPVMIFALGVGARRLPILLLVAATIFATHSLFAHKEYRFVYPALPLLITLAGLGTADILGQVGRRFPRIPVAATMIAGVSLWSGLSMIVALRPFMNPSWTREAGFFGAFRDIDRIPAACGVGNRPCHRVTRKHVAASDNPALPNPHPDDDAGGIPKG